MNLLTKLTSDTIAQHTGWGAYTVTSSRPGAAPVPTSPMRLRRLLETALEAGGGAVLLHAGTLRCTTGPDGSEEFTATPGQAAKRQCRWCLHWKSEHHPGREPDENTNDYLARLDGLQLTSCASDFAPLTDEDRSICTRCSQYRAEHAKAGHLDADYEDLTVACSDFTTAFEPEPDWDEEDDEWSEADMEDCARCGKYRKEHEPLHQVVGACDDFEGEPE
ncbi:hypothetical protein [Kitasatospora sp. NPDC088548]|uniref:hypothetical protein n=1 Tax=Kitasatospora sp. NPDC088548 TaxID=3364075 RepID=UPI0037F10C40